MNSHEDYASGAGYHLADPAGDRVVLLLHGLGADHRQPLALVDSAALGGATVLAPDARAHGKTNAIGGPEDFAFSAMVDDLSALVTRLGQADKPTDIVGISMGAALALRAALSGKFDVRRLVLIRPAFCDRPNPDNLSVMATIGRLLEESEADIARERFAASADYAAIAAVTRLGAESLLNQFELPQARERSVRLRAVPGNRAYATLEELSLITAPVTVVGTDRDPVHPLPLAEQWAAAMTSSGLETIPPRDIDPAHTQERLREIVLSALE
jgi:pimeloyl-ACP methyl ester carboxylesterase